MDKRVERAATWIEKKSNDIQLNTYLTEMFSQSIRQDLERLLDLEMWLKSKIREWKGEQIESGDIGE